MGISNHAPAPPSPEQDTALPARTIRRLVDYVGNVGLDPRSIARGLGLDIDQLVNAPDEVGVPSLYYALIYKACVDQLERDGRLVPWAVGLGGQGFSLMCHAIITCRTVEQALVRASEFSRFVAPITGHSMKLEMQDDATCRLHYDIDEGGVRRSFAPANWSMDQCVSVARSSGIETWFGLAGWLIGRSVEVKAAAVRGKPLSKGYAQRLRDIFQCPIAFGSEGTWIDLARKTLEHRVVHDIDSLQEFLRTGPYQLWSTEDRVVSTSVAVKSLLGTDLRDGAPTFERMAESLHMSPSTLRRHLQAEDTSYQKLKNQRRFEIAVELLCMSDMKVAEIGDQVGFADTSSFVRSFRAWTGVTPKVYRDQADSMKVTELT